MTSQTTGLNSKIEPLAIHQAIWQDDTVSRAVLTVTQTNAFCFASANNAMANSFLRKIADCFPDELTVSSSQLSTVDIIGKYITDTLPAQLSQQFHHYCNQCIRTQRPVSFEVAFKEKLSTPSASEQHWQLRLNPLQNDEQSVHQLVVSATNVSAWKQTELQLKADAQNTRTILDSMQEAVFIHDVDSKVVDVNTAVLELYQATREEALRLSIADECALPETPVHLLPDLWHRALQGEQVAIDWPSKRPSDGARLDLKVVLRKISLSGQTRLIACVRDVTEQKQLEAQQNRLLTIIEATPDLVGIADTRGNTLYLNHAGREMLGMSAEEINGFHISETIPAQHRETFISNTLPQAIAQGSWSGECLLERRSGEILPTSQVLISHKDASGKPEYLSTITRDISDFKAVEATLRDQKQFLDSIYRGANLVMFAWDLVDEVTRELRCSGWNPSCAAATGLSEESVIGKSPIDVFGPEGGAAVIENNLRCIEEQQPIEYEEKIVFDGSPTWWTTKLNPIRDTTGKIYRVVGTTTDITEAKLHTIKLETYSERQAQQAEALKAALAELKRTQAQAVQSEKMSSLGQMVAGIAHEINNPVNFIHANVSPASGYATELLELVELYQEIYPKPPVVLTDKLEEIDLEFVKKDFIKLLNSMKVGTQRIREIVLSLRNFSRLDEADIKRVDLHQGIDSTLVILSHRLRATGQQIPVKVTKSYELRSLVECYPSQLNQVMMNILANAIDAVDAAEQPHIHIATDIQESQAIVTISDNGDGMPETVSANIFDPFFTTKPIGKGTGMGLSIGYQIVTERHGGSLSVESQLGQGTTFTIAIPLKQPMDS